MSGIDGLLNDVSNFKEFVELLAKDEQEKYKNDNYIDISCSLAWNEFGTFKEMRKSKIKEQLLKAFKLSKD